MPHPCVTCGPTAVAPIFDKRQFTKENLALGCWVSYQRKRYKHSCLTADHTRRLEALGFTSHGCEHEGMASVKQAGPPKGALNRSR
jgi:Helicase associated domain